MAKPAKKPKSIAWTKSLDESAVQEALEEATVDAHDEDERHSGLLAAIGDQLAFPFQAQVLGEVVTVVGMEWPEDDEFGLDMVVERNGERHRVEVRRDGRRKSSGDGSMAAVSVRGRSRGVADCRLPRHSALERHLLDLAFVDRANRLV